METPTSRRIIQGGMGAGISGSLLAKTVSNLGQRGTISGVFLGTVMARRLQQGDPGGHLRRALSHFPFPRVVEKILSLYYLPEGLPPGKPYRRVPAFSIQPPWLLIALTVCANFAFVWLAKESHENPISINYLEKIAMPHIYAITGAMLAGVDVITMGAGVALQIPGVIEDIANGGTATYRVPVVGKQTSYTMSFNPENFFGKKLPTLTRPAFLPIIASNLLADIFMQKLPPGSVSGFVIEEWTAGGHNAPPRKLMQNEQGEPLPIYGDKDVVNYRRIAELGLPFWIGGAKASPETFQWALSVGATGIQVGSIFALCEESDMDIHIKMQIRQLGFDGKLNIKTDMRISPTGFPFKVAALDGTISDPSVYNARQRICNQGALVSLYERPDGTIGYRCASEPEKSYVKKGGNIEDTVGRGCLCNALSVTAGIGDEGEPAVVTLGDDLSFLPRIMKSSSDSYTARDAINYLLS